MIVIAVVRIRPVHLSDECTAPSGRRPSDQVS